MEERIFHVLMREVCEELDIKVEKLSYDWILQLSKDGKICHVTGSRFDLNPEATGEIACDKYATYEVLCSQKVPVIKHTMIFNPKTRTSLVGNEGNFSKITSEFLKYGKLVVKPNNGCEGIGVYLCNSMKEVEMAVLKLFETQDSISICPYYDIKTEYRTFYLDGEVKLIYGKTKPFVIGNGKSTMGELIEKLNLPDKSVVKENLKKLDLSYVPIKNEKVELSWKHNLSGGAKPDILQDCELHKRIEKLAIDAAHAMNIKFATIDIIETTNDELLILEINSGVCATIFSETVENSTEIIKDIYRQAVKKLFEE